MIKKIEIKRTFPKGLSQQNNDLKTKKIFVGGILAIVSDDEFKNFFSKHDDLLTDGNII
jgi:RNA recognition motif-containing protein